MRWYTKIFAWAGLVIYAAILFLLMTFYRLPGDNLIAATLESFTKGRLQFKAQKTSFALPTNFILEDVSYGFLLGNALTKDRFKSLTFGPDYKRLLTGYLPVNFKGIMPRGNIYGKTGVSIGRGIEDGYLNITVSDIYLEDLNSLRSISNRNLMGKLQGQIKIKGHLTDPTKIEGEGHFYVQKGSIGTRIDLPGLQTLFFENIEVLFSIKDGMITLNKSVIKGPMLSGDFSGEIKLNKKIADSQLEIKAKMQPGPLLEKNQLTSQFLSKIRQGDNPLNIKVSGTLESPTVTWIQ